MNRRTVAFVCSAVLSLVAPLTAFASEKPALPEHTEVHLQLAETISTSFAKVGEVVRFRTVGDTSVNGNIVIPDGTEAEGAVIHTKRKGHLGHSGAITIKFVSVRVGSEKVMLDGLQEWEGTGHGTRTAVATTATAVVFWPAAPFLLLMHGGDVTLTPGTPVSAYTTSDPQ